MSGFKNGMVTVPMADDQQKIKAPFIPKGVSFIVGKDDKHLQKLMSAIVIKKHNRVGVPALLVGPTGCGKTSQIKYLAQETGNAYRRIQLNGNIGIDGLVGKWLIKDGATYWVDGVLTDAMRKGHWVVLDEVNMALPDVLAVLNSLLDDEQAIVLDEKDGERVEAHKDFRLFATMNPTEDYTGTKELNRAFIDRFSIVIDVDYPDAIKEVQIIQTQTNISDISSVKADKTVPQRMVIVAKEVRHLFNQSTIHFIISTRNLVDWAIFAPILGVKEAARVTIYNKAGKEDEKKLNDVFNNHFRNDEMAYEKGNEPDGIHKHIIKTVYEKIEEEPVLSDMPF